MHKNESSINKGIPWKEINFSFSFSHTKLNNTIICDIIQIIQLKFKFHVFIVIETKTIALTKQKTKGCINL